MRGQSRPQLLGHEGHERMEQPQDVVEAEVGDVLCGRVACAQAILRGFEIPIAKLIPSKGVSRRHRVLESEALDTRCDGSGCIGKLRKNPTVLHVLVDLERAWFPGRR